MHPGAEGRQDTDAPVTDLVAESLDDDRPVVGDHTGRLRLLFQEREEVRGGSLVEVMALAEGHQRLGGRDRTDRTGELTDRTAELDRPTGARCV